MCSNGVRRMKFIPTIINKLLNIWLVYKFQNIEVEITLEFLLCDSAIIRCGDA